MEPFSMTFQERRRRWQFPHERFVTYERSDEPWCRYFGIGEEVEETVEITIPRAVITGLEPDGTVHITGLAEPAVPLDVQAK